MAETQYAELCSARKKISENDLGIVMVPGVGFEPTSPDGPQILSLLRMPFRHPGTNYYFLQTSDKVPAGFAPANNGFADRRVSCFTTAPL